MLVFRFMALVIFHMAIVHANAVDLSTPLIPPTHQTSFETIETIIDQVNLPDILQISDKSFFDNYQEPIAHVRIGTNLCIDEIETIAERKTKALPIFNKIVQGNLSLKDIPTVGIVGSGGGFRAAIALLGVLRGLEKIKVLDAVTYLATLSGSTWSAASWITHNTTLDQLTSYLKVRLENSLSPKNIDEGALIKRMLKKMKTFTKLTLNDLWGGLIGDIFFRTDSIDGQKVYLHDIEPQVRHGLFPIPLFTAVIGETDPYYQWVEFSPFEVGSSYLNSWIPPFAFGKKFKKGICTDKKRKETFGYILGTCGSTYAASVSDAIKSVLESMEAKFEVDLPSYIPGFSFGHDIRFSPPEVYNFSRHLDPSPLKKDKYLTLVDAGVATCLPFQPLFRRNAVLYIVCDASGDSTSVMGNEMREVEAYAHQNGFAFPKIDYDKLAKQKISIWADPEDPRVPIIIHLPNFQDFSTLKFDYSEEEFDQLMGNLEDTIIENKELFVEALQHATCNVQALNNI